MATARIAISLPPALLRKVERVRRQRRTTRSSVFRMALESWLAQQAERDRVRRYVEDYRRNPESSEDLADVHEASKRILRKSPW